MSINTKYSAVPVGNVISGMGMLARGRSDSCHQIQVELENCSAAYDGAPVTTMIRDDGIVITRRADRGVVRIEVPNCNSTSLVVWAMCLEEGGMGYMRIVITRGFNLKPTSHGIMGECV